MTRMTRMICGYPPVALGATGTPLFLQVLRHQQYGKQFFGYSNFQIFANPSPILCDTISYEILWEELVLQCLNCVCVYITIERFLLAYSLNKTRRYNSNGSILISMAGPRLGIADGIGCHFFISLHTQTKWKNIWAVSDKNRLYLKNCTPNGMGYTSKIMIGNMMIHQ
jgi:hypothetical protein